MHKFIQTSVMIFTLNEEIHLPICLESLQNFDDVIVVDSYSTDRTEEICQRKGVRFFQHKFEGFGNQRNWAMDNIETKYQWILILDADERVSKELAEEIRSVVQKPGGNVGAYRVKRRFFMWGRWLKYSSLYPTWVVRLVHRERVRYLNRGHAETQEVNGEIRELQFDLIDENLKGIDEWFERQNRYTSKDAKYELSLQTKLWNYSDLLSSNPLKRRNLMKMLISRMPGRGLIYFLYSYIWRRGFLDGRDGFIFCLMRSLYQTSVSIKKYDICRQSQQQAIKGYKKSLKL